MKWQLKQMTTKAATSVLVLFSIIGKKILFFFIDNKACIKNPKKQ